MRSAQWFIGIVCAIILGLLAMTLAPSVSMETVTLTGRQETRITVDVEIADTPAERERGLMHRTALSGGTGMLFVFEQEQPLSFWMKDTLIPLDIVFFDADGSFVSSASMVPCTADPCTIYASSEPAAMALEVPSGFIKTYMVGRGWHLKRGR